VNQFSQTPDEDASHAAERWQHDEEIRQARAQRASRVEASDVPEPADNHDYNPRHAAPTVIHPPAARIACPRCGMPAGAKCINKNVILHRYHTERTQAASQAAPPKPGPATAKAINAAIGGLPTSQAAPPDDGLTILDRAVQMLVAEHTLGAVLDAAWAAAHRLNPRQ